MTAPRDPTLVLFGATDADELREQIDAVEADPDAEIDLPESASLRAAALARDPDALSARLEDLRTWLSETEEGSTPTLRSARGLFLGSGAEPARIGFLFPGQGAPVYTDAGAIGQRLPCAARIFDHADLPAKREDVPPELVQVAVFATSLAALAAMRELGIEAELGLGHSMGELCALHWAGAVDEPGALSIAQAGETVTAHASADGTMATVLGDEDTFSRVAECTGVSVAAFNSPNQRVLSGTVEAISSAVEHARALGASAVPLRVTGAYHTPLMWEAIRDFQAHLETVPMRPLTRRVISTVTGTTLGPDAPLRELMARQFCEPVQFVDAATEAARDTDLLIELGPGKMLAGLVSEFTDTPAISTRAGAASAYGLLEAAGAAYAAGAPVQVERLLATSDPEASQAA